MSLKSTPIQKITWKTKLRITAADRLLKNFKFIWLGPKSGSNKNLPRLNMFLVRPTSFLTFIKKVKKGNYLIPTKWTTKFNSKPFLQCILFWVMKLHSSYKTTLWHIGIITIIWSWHTSSPKTIFDQSTWQRVLTVMKVLSTPNTVYIWRSRHICCYVFTF